MIHALAGALQLDVYVVSLSASWISDSTLTTLMGRVPARCVVLLEDLDAAFTRSTSRDVSAQDDDKDGDKKDGEEGDKATAGFSMSRKRRDQLSDVNTLSLSGLLNALDGVAAAEGRLLFATTNHLEKLDPALSRPGRMDVWIEFRNASKWQAEALFRNFFPCVEDEAPMDVSELEGMDMKVEVNERSSSSSALPRSYIATPPTPTINISCARAPSSSSLGISISSLRSLAPSFSLFSSDSKNGDHHSSSTLPASLSPPGHGNGGAQDDAATGLHQTEKFGASNTAYRPPSAAENSRQSVALLDKKILNEFAKMFADGIPEDEFSVAALQGCKSLLSRSLLVCGLIAMHRSVEKQITA